jgi:soluble lytic murein transglycosylase-like protein
VADAAGTVAEAGAAVVAQTGRAAAEGAEAITAPVMSLASTTAAGAAAAINDIAGEGSAARNRLDQLISAYSAHYDVPETLVRRVVKRESNFRPGARNGPYWGLMQIRHDTARGMGYDGPASGLLDAETNLKYAVRYLRGAYLVAKGNHDLAVRYYARGYYYDAKRAGLLDETGLGRDRRRMR